MIANAYLRVARGRNGKPIVKAGSKPSSAPLYDYQGDALATVAFAVSLTIPEECFDAASRVVADILVPETAVEIAGEVIE